MTNQRRLLFALPAGLGTVLAGVLGVFVLWPQWRQVQIGKSRAAELRDLQTRLPLMDGQLRREQDGILAAQRQQSVVLQLISGSGALSTFLGQLDRLAALSGVRLALFEPLEGEPVVPEAKGKSAPASPADSKDKQPSKPADPLLAPGLAKQEMLVSATGSYPALLAFMRQIEKLSVLVVQSNLQLALEEPKDKANAPAALPVVLKMSVATYAKK